MWVTKLLIPPVKIWIVCPKTTKLARNWHFVQCLAKISYKKVPRWFFVMWAPKLLLSPVKIRILCLKTTQICPKIAFLVILGQALPAHLVPCWWVGWWLWRAGCISQDTYLLYLFVFVQLSLAATKKLDIISQKFVQSVQLRY